MPKRTVCINSPAKLSSKNRQLVVSNENGAVEIPFEDIWVLVLETQLATCTSALLSDLSEAGIGILTCGKNHMPIGLQLPLAAHSRHAAIVEDQLLISKPLKKQLWKKIVERKIANQAKCLELLNISGSEYLYECSRSVLSDDSSGREAVAASFYFKRLIPEGNRRESKYTAALDYGYAILRAGIARSAVAGGWLVSRGIHHKNDLNAFNLVDDLIEAFRPSIDLVVFSLHDATELTPQVKRDLVKIFEYVVAIDGKMYTVQSAIEEELFSLREAILNKDADCLHLPKLLPLELRPVDSR